MILKTDLNGNVIMTATSFTTDDITISGADYNEISVPDNAAEAIIQSAESFYVGESSSAEGFLTVGVHVGVASMNKIYIKGTAGQHVYIMWVKL